MARPTKRQQQYRYVGRATKLTEEVIRKMEECAAIRATVQELCFYAGIHRDTYYTWMKQNPELSDRLDDLRQKPFLKARQTIIGGLDDVNVAFKFMEKEKPEDYADILNIKHSGAIGTEEISADDKEAIAAFHAILKENIKKRNIEKAKEIGEIKN